MPLIHSKSDAAFKTNLKNLMGERGVSPHVKDAKQALAIAYATKRRGRAMGGNAFPSFKPPNMNPSFAVRGEAHNMARVGPIMSSVPGRTDHHAISVPSGSYIFPADHVSSLGQGNTAAGMKVLSNMFPGSGSGPYGAGSMGIAHGGGLPKPPRPMSDSGGARGEGSSGSVPIMAAGGEFIASPQDVARIGGGDIKHGHEVLDKWVVENRKNHVKTLKKLPGPAKS